MLLPERLARAGLGLVLIVVFASAAIRLGAEGAALTALRATHRGAATLAVLVVLALAWLAWRARGAWLPVALAGLLVVALSVIGVLGGQKPPFAVAMANIVGGLALAATFAWLAGCRTPGILTALLVAQAALGAWLSLTWSNAPLALLLLHALAGLALAAAAAVLALRLPAPALRAAIALLALAAPAAGALAAVLDRPLLPALAHATAAALLIAGVALAQSGRA